LLGKSLRVKSAVRSPMAGIDCSACGQIDVAHEFGKTLRHFDPVVSASMRCLNS